MALSSKEGLRRKRWYNQRSKGETRITEKEGAFRRNGKMPENHVFLQVRSLWESKITKGSQEAIPISLGVRLAGQKPASPEIEGGQA